MSGLGMTTMVGVFQTRESRGVEERRGAQWCKVVRGGAEAPDEVLVTCDTNIYFICISLSYHRLHLDLRGVGLKARAARLGFNVRVVWMVGETSWWGGRE